MHLVFLGRGRLRTLCGGLCYLGGVIPSTIRRMATTRASRLIRAPREAVYGALLNRDAVQQWMVPEGMTSEIHEFDSREGGAFRISLTYDDRSRSGKTREQTDTFHGTFAKLVPSTEVVQIVEFETDDPSLRGMMTIRYLLADSPEGTDVTGIHEDLPAGVSPEQNQLGWNMSMDRLARLVEG